MNFEGGGAFEKQEILRDKYIIIFSLFKKKKNEMKIEIFIYQKNNNKCVCFCGIYSVMIYT